MTIRPKALSMGLKDHELDHIVSSLGREPTLAEAAVFAGMWSEHCSYKSTRKRLGTLPREAPYVLAGPGSHAGAVDVGEGWAVAFKIESHNHPSAVEPYQGAATGVGGILRDVIAQGARPCVVMDSLCFGLPSSPIVKHLRDGVVAGIAGYGNAFGVPNAGGKTVFDERYEGNPLVNALAAGLVRHDGMRTARAAGVGNAVIYAGAATGRDGILGAAFASEELGHENVEKRSHVQVGDPFTGKKLMEACLSFDASLGLVACQDMGACGLTCAASEMAAVGGVGIDLTLDAVPLRERDMLPFEILVSESQERFLFVVDKAHEQEALEHFRSYGVHAAIVGRVTTGTQFRALWHGETVVDLPAKLVAEGTPPANWPEASSLPPVRPFPSFAADRDLTGALKALLSTPGLADLAPIYQRYDHTVGNRTVRGPGEAEAAVQKLPDSHRGFALTITGRGEVCAVDPHRGAMAALGEACRNLACVGARMLAITDGLNNGSPSDPVENKRLSETIRGLRDGLLALGVPVTGGNVSLYNESPKGAIPPTPMIGAIGVIDDVRKVPAGGLAPGLALVLLGTLQEAPTYSVYGRVKTGQSEGAPPEIDLAADHKLAELIVAQVSAGRVRAAKDCGAGGLSVALAKLCLRGACGATVPASVLASVTRKDWALFGEYSGLAWLAVDRGDAQAVLDDAQHAGVSAVLAGEAGGDRLVIGDVVSASLADLATAWSGTTDPKRIAARRPEVRA